MEDNKLIAEFMGHTFADFDLGGLHYLIDGNYVEYISLQYHTSWDWLMPVVDKIEKELEEEFRVVMLEDECSIYQKTEDQKLQSSFECVAEIFATSKIEATYDAVVEFIKQNPKWKAIN
jgi:hypothetical protein